jgi:hypothetical protein
MPIISTCFGIDIDPLALPEDAGTKRPESMGRVNGIENQLIHKAVKLTHPEDEAARRDKNL